MIIEKTKAEKSYDINLDDFVAEGELTVTITLNEYRDLIKTKTEAAVKKDHENWLEQYTRANKAEQRVAELETEVQNFYKRLADKDGKTEDGETSED